MAVIIEIVLFLSYEMFQDMRDIDNIYVPFSIFFETNKHEFKKKYMNLLIEEDNNIYIANSLLKP